MDAEVTWRPTTPPLPEELAGLVRGLVPLREGEDHRPHYVEATRPTTAVAAYPGGVVPEDMP